MTFDLANLAGLTEAQEAGTDLELKHPATGKPLDIVLRVVSYESERCKRVRRVAMDRALKSQGRRQVTAYEIEESTRDLVASAIVGWSGMEYQGAALDCTPENVKRILTEFPWIGEQVDAVAQDRAAFFRG